MGKENGKDNDSDFLGLDGNPVPYELSDTRFFKILKDLSSNARDRFFKLIKKLRPPSEEVK